MELFILSKILNNQEVPRQTRDQYLDLVVHKVKRIKFMALQT